MNGARMDSVGLRIINVVAYVVKGIRMIRGWELVRDRIQLNMVSTECGLVLGVWCARVVEEGVISQW